MDVKDGFGQLVGSRWRGLGAGGRGMALGLCLAMVGSTSAVAWDRAHPFPVTDLWAVEDVSDGLTRVVVTTASQRQIPQLVVAGSALPQAFQRSSASQSTARPRVDVDKLARAQQQLGGDGQLVALDGVLYYVDPNGARIVSAGPGFEVSLDVVREAVRKSSPAPASSASPAAQPFPPSGSTPSPRQTEAVPAPPADDDGVPDMVRWTAASPAELAALRAVPGVRDVQVNADSTLLVTASLSQAALAALPGIADAQPSIEVPVLEVRPSDPLFDYAWNLENTGWAYQQESVAGADVDAQYGWEGSLGQGVVIAIVDTGFDSDHPDLAGSLWQSPSESCGSTDENGNGKAGDCHG